MEVVCLDERGFTDPTRRTSIPSERGRRWEKAHTHLEHPVRCNKTKQECEPVNGRGSKHNRAAQKRSSDF